MEAAPVLAVLILHTDGLPICWCARYRGFLISVSLFLGGPGTGLYVFLTLIGQRRKLASVLDRQERLYRLACGL